MKLTNTRRAAMGLLVILILAMFTWWRRAGKPFTQTDYMLIGAAVFLVTLNMIASYYFDRSNHERGLKGK